MKPFLLSTLITLAILQVSCLIQHRPSQVVSADYVMHIVKEQAEFNKASTDATVKLDRDILSLNAAHHELQEYVLKFGGFLDETMKRQNLMASEIRELQRRSAPASSSGTTHHQEGSDTPTSFLTT